MYRIFLRVTADDKPTTKIEGDLLNLPFNLQVIVDYLRRKAVLELDISDEDESNNKLLTIGHKFKEVYNESKSDLEKQEEKKIIYIDQNRQHYDKAAAEMMKKNEPYHLCLKFLNQDERFRILCNEIEKSTISKLKLNYIKLSENNLKLLINSIANNPYIKKTSYYKCDETLVKEIENARVKHEEIIEPSIDLEENLEIKNEHPNSHKGYINYSFLMNCLTTVVTSLVLAAVFTLAISPMAGIAIGITGGAVAFFTLNRFSVFQELDRNNYEHALIPR